MMLVRDVIAATVLYGMEIRKWSCLMLTLLLTYEGAQNLQFIKI